MNAAAAGRRLLRWALVTVGMVLVVVPCAVAPALASPRSACTPVGAPKMVTMRTVPPVSGFVFAYGGVRRSTGLDGVARFVTVGCRGAALRAVTRVLQDPIHQSELRFSRWYGPFRLGGSTPNVTATFSSYYSLRFRFINRQGEAVPRSALGPVTLKSSLGVITALPAGTDQITLQGQRVVVLNEGLQLKPVYFSVQSVMAQGSNLVNRSQNKFFPARKHEVTVPLQFYSADVRARDTLFGFGLGTQLILTAPDGSTREVPLTRGKVLLPDLPRGTYHMAVKGPGISLTRPVSMSRDQVVDLKVVSYLDVALVLGVVVLAAVLLLWIGRRRSVREPIGPGPDVDGDREPTSLSMLPR